MKPVAMMSAMRPSMIADVSTSFAVPVATRSPPVDSNRAGLMPMRRRIARERRAPTMANT